MCVAYPDDETASDWLPRARRRPVGKNPEVLRGSGGGGDARSGPGRAGVPPRDGGPGSAGGVPALLGGSRACWGGPELPGEGSGRGGVERSPDEGNPPRSAPAVGWSLGEGGARRGEGLAVGAFALSSCPKR